MSMAAGGVHDISAAVEGPHSGSFLWDHGHSARPNSHREADPPLYTKHHHHYHPVEPEGTGTRPAEDWLTTELDLPVAVTEKPSATPTRRVNFTQDYETEDSTFHYPMHGLVHSDVDPPTPSFLPQPPGLRRGLQIPSRWSIITWGFSLPPLLANAGVTKVQWKLFTHELKSHAFMSAKQWVTFAAVMAAHGVVFGCFLGPALGTIPSTILNYRWQKKTEQANFEAAQNTGVLDMFVQRWNLGYFEPLGLHVAVALPDMGRMDDMDVSTTKLFKYQQKVGAGSTMAGTASMHGYPKEARYQRREGHQRVKAAHKARIIVMPLELFQARLQQGQREGNLSGPAPIDENPFSDWNVNGDAVTGLPAL